MANIYIALAVCSKYFVYMNLSNPQHLHSNCSLSSWRDRPTFIQKTE